MNANVKTNEVFALKNLISYEEGSIANMDVVSTPDMKYVLMAFDEGTGLTPHRAPGNAIVFALEGKATIGYEGKDYELSEGECFRFEKNGLHSVTANGKFKMALLLVLEKFQKAVMNDGQLLLTDVARLCYITAGHALAT